MNPFPLFVFTGLPAASLWALFALAGAVTVGLYLLKLRRRRVEVPFLPLWESLLVERKASALRSRLQRWFSLLLSLLLVAALVMALGEPKQESEVRQGRSLVVLIDVSASMGQMEDGKTRLSIAKERVKKWFLSLADGDQLLLVEMGADPRPLLAFSADRTQLSQALVELRPLEVSADLDAGLQLARDALRGRSSPQVIVVSDGAHPPDEVSPVDLPPLFFEPVARLQEEAPPNLTITSFSARRYPSARDRFEVLVEVASSDDAEVELSVFASSAEGSKGRVLDVHRFRVQEQSRFVRSYEDLAYAEEGLIAEIRRVDETEEPFVADNIARTLLAPLEPLRVLVVGEPNNFLDAALLVEESLVIQRTSAQGYPPKEDFDVTIFDGVFPERVARTGAALYLGTGDEATEYPVELGYELSLFGFDTWKKDSPVFRLIDPYNVQVLQGRTLRPATEDQVLGSSGGKAIMVAGERAEGRFIALGFHPTQSDFVLRAVWPLFMLNVLDDLAPRGRSDAQLGVQTGSLWRPPAPLESGSATLKGPQRGNGPVSKRTVLVESGRAAVFGSEAGFYEIESQEGSTRFAASLLSGVEGSLPSNDKLALGETIAKPVLGMEPRGDRAPWIWLLLAVVGLSFVEWWTYHRRWTV